LQYWAVICASAVILLSLTAIITNDLISSKQQILEEKLVPGSNIIRNLDQILGEYELRKQELLAAKTTEDPGNYLATYLPEDIISGYLSRLSILTADIDDLNNIVPGLEWRFDQLFSRNSEFVNCLSQNIPQPDGNMEMVTGPCDDATLSEISAALNESSKSLLKSLKRVSNLTAEKINAHSTLSHDLSLINLAVVVTVSLLVISVIIAGISLVIYRIGDPLNKVRVAMHDLSSGDMSRRLEENQEIRDEFSELTADFNIFAERLQNLFDEVIAANTALENSEKRVRAILENALVGIAHVRDGRILAVNRKFEEIFGYARDEIYGMPKHILYPTADDHKAINEAAAMLLAHDETYQGEWKMKHKNGTIFWCAVSAKSISEQTREEGVIWLFEDITQRKRSEEELLHLANYDSLTGLPNRSLFMDRLEQGIGRTSRKNSLLGLLYIDLDRFKIINDSMGHTTGDELLKLAGNRFFECVRNSDTVCRLGGDEFTIILPEMQDISDAGKVAEKILMVMKEPFDLNGEQISISPSIGVSIYPDDAEDIESLLKNADSAMYFAKSKGRNNYQYYTQEMNAEARQRLDRENRLRRAVEFDQFMLYYQPQVETKTLQITGYEALIRWHDSETGLVSPDQFVPLLEDTGLIIPVGDWILRRACLDIKEMSAMNEHFHSVSINLSARQFVDHSIVDRIRLIMEETGVSPSQLVIEITETIMMTETERSLKLLTELSELGVKLSLDDFGTGYSSLAYLKQFPINVLKIDKSFIRDLHTNDSDSAICEAIIAIGHQLNLKVVAEGVETEAQFNYLRDKGCHIIQGYYFGKPAPIHQLLCNICHN
jgi:diguanylate cyclase (GGDEF)-like protein/PAS domain S-box-containing protein